MDLGFNPLTSSVPRHAEPSDWFPYDREHWSLMG